MFFIPIHKLVLVHDCMYMRKRHFSSDVYCMYYVCLYAQEYKAFIKTSGFILLTCSLERRYSFFFYYIVFPTQFFIYIQYKQLCGKIPQNKTKTQNIFFLNFCS